MSGWTGPRPYNFQIAETFESPLDPSLANYSLLGRERWRTLAELTSVDDGFPLSGGDNQN